MKDFLPKIKNWWWYNKLWVLAAAAAVAVLVYCFVPSKNQENPDYHVAVVTNLPLREEEKTELELRLEAWGEDVNGDGGVAVMLHTYAVDLADPGPNAGNDNYQVVASLDADIVGNVSGIFLLEDPEIFQQVTNSLLREEIITFDERLSIGLREDANPIYNDFLEKLTA